MFIIARNYLSDVLSGSGSNTLTARTDLLVGHVSPLSQPPTPPPPPPQLQRALRQQRRGVLPDVDLLVMHAPHLLSGHSAHLRCVRVSYEL